MKKLIAGLTLAAFVVLPVARAGETKSSDTSKPACAGKAACADQTKVTTAKASASAKSACTEKSTCCHNEKTARKVANPDSKGATFLVKR